MKSISERNETATEPDQKVPASSSHNQDSHFLQTWHVILHNFNVSLINSCKHTNKCPMFPQYTFPFTFFINA